jgi:hypothetical protein
MNTKGNTEGIEPKEETIPVFVGAGDKFISLTPIDGKGWTHKGKEASLFVNAPNGARGVIVDALAKTFDEDMKSSNSNVIIWDMPASMKKLVGKTEKGAWKFQVTITDEMLDSWLDTLIENLRPKGAVKPQNEPIIAGARAKLAKKLSEINNGSVVNEDDEL